MGMTRAAATDLDLRHARERHEPQPCAFGDDLAARPEPQGVTAMGASSMKRYALPERLPQ